jgi:hypothetical protein
MGCHCLQRLTAYFRLFYVPSSFLTLLVSSIGYCELAHCAVVFTDHGPIGDIASRPYNFGGECPNPGRSSHLIVSGNIIPRPQLVLALYNMINDQRGLIQVCVHSFSVAFLTVARFEARPQVARRSFCTSCINLFSKLNQVHASIESRAVRLARSLLSISNNSRGDFPTIWVEFTFS